MCLQLTRAPRAPDSLDPRRCSGGRAGGAQPFSISRSTPTMRDTPPITTQQTYERALRHAHMPAHARRTAAANAAFFLPRLQPGMRLLDCGCGPGSITAGLAEAVAPRGGGGIDGGGGG